MDRMLVICCTRGRPELAKQMYVSILKTSTVCDVIFCIDYNDPKLKEYNWIPHCMKIIGENKTTVQYENDIFKLNPNYSFYHITNDDVVYETNDWDVALMKKGKISHGDDKCQGELLCSLPIIDGDIVRALGWLVYPKITHLFGDSIWKLIGDKLNIRHYDKNVITNHKHYMYNKKVEKDDTYKKTNSREMYDKDFIVFNEWIRDNMINDCEKIRRALCK